MGSVKPHDRTNGGTRNTVSRTVLTMDAEGIAEESSRRDALPGAAQPALDGDCYPHLKTLSFDDLEAEIAAGAKPEADTNQRDGAERFIQMVNELMELSDRKSAGLACTNDYLGSNSRM